MDELTVIIAAVVALVALLEVWARWFAQSLPTVAPLDDSAGPTTLSAPAPVGVSIPERFVASHRITVQRLSAAAGPESPANDAPQDLTVMGKEESTIGAMLRTQQAADIFISYDRSDRDTASLLAITLAHKGWPVWWDQHIPAGKDFSKEIEHRLEMAKCVVVLWSKESAASDWVCAEAANALSRGVLIPAALDGAEVPLQFRRIQTAPLAGWDGTRSHVGLRMLIGSIGALIGRPRPAYGQQVQA